MLESHPALKDKFKFLNPFAKRDFRDGGYTHWREVVVPDKTEISVSDIVVVNPWKPSFGTPMEVIYAFERHKTVYTLWPKHYGRISPWLEAHSTFIFTSWNELISHLGAIQ